MTWLVRRLRDPPGLPLFVLIVFLYSPQPSSVDLLASNSSHLALLWFESFLGSCVSECLGLINLCFVFIRLSLSLALFLALAILVFVFVLVLIVIILVVVLFDLIKGL